MNKIFLILLIILFDCAYALDYDYTSVEKIPVKLNITESILSEKSVYEGQPVEFKVIEDVEYNNETIIKKDTIAKANVSMIITSGMNGIPASIIFDNFNIEGINSKKLSNNYEVFGQDRSLWVFPLKWALTPIPPTGSLTNFIKGGHAKLSDNKTVIIYYYPQYKD